MRFRPIMLGKFDKLQGLLWQDTPIYETQHPTGKTLSTGQGPKADTGVAACLGSGISASLSQQQLPHSEYAMLAPTQKVLVIVERRKQEQ